MIRINGAYGEGGGQILRYAAALAAATGEEIEVSNIRAKRHRPGLRPQHVTSLKILKLLFGGSIDGLRIGSRRVLISLGGPKSGDISYDIGTAGSIPLVIQSITPALILADSPSTITLTGGTEVKWSPTIDYMMYVYKGIVSLFGAELRITILKRGYYPKGGGKVKVEVTPSPALSSTSFNCRGDIYSIIIRSIVSLLPSNIVDRQAASILVILKKFLGDVKDNVIIKKYLLDHDTAAGPGTSTLTVANHTNDIIYSGGDSIGERGKPAEKVGEESALKFVKWYSSGAVFDVNAGDMVIPFAALAYSHSYFTVPEVTDHIKSALYIIKEILDVNYKIKKINCPNCFRIDISRS